MSMLRNKTKPTYYADVESCVEETLAKVGKHIVLGTPLGLGKPNQLINEFFRRARKDSSLKLKIFTALSLARPPWKNDFERRLLEPLSARIFGNYPELDYVSALSRSQLPANIEVSEFYFQPGKFLNSFEAQQNYISSNYTHVVRDALDNGINVFAQLISSANDQTRYSLSCNPDLTPDLIPKMRAQESAGRKIAILGQVNPELPFMYGDAVVSPESFDAIVDNPRYAFTLFASPDRAVDPAEYMIGLHASTLIKDGGTIQLGIGSLNDALTYLIDLRHKHNATYHSLLSEVGVVSKFSESIQSIGETSPFEEGLYAASEMFVDGFRQLYQSGILKRKVYPEKILQRLLNEKKISHKVTPSILSCLLEEKIIASDLREKDVNILKQWGIFKAAVSYKDGFIHCGEGIKIPADLTDKDAAQKIYQHCLGDQLKGGHLLHASFFLGPKRFYDFLHELTMEERQQFSMDRVSYVNELYGDEELKRLQRKKARFFNSALMVTLDGATISDKLEDGRVVSGVGGQYNFVAMAHALSDARSIIILRSTREKYGEVRSNIVWNYGHTTLPSHLRDLVVTEYGIADLRGKNDYGIIIALLNISNSRFQESLLKEAKRAKKIPASYQIPERFKNNHPDRLRQHLSSYKEQGLFPEFPLGTEFMKEEIALIKALELLQTIASQKRFSLPNLQQLKMIISKPESATPYLKRLDLDKPKTPREKLMQKSILYALSQTGII